MVGYKYIVLPCEGKPYLATKGEKQPEYKFIQDKVDGNFQESQSELILHPIFYEDWAWVKEVKQNSKPFLMKTEDMNVVQIWHLEC